MSSIPGLEHKLEPYYAPNSIAVESESTKQVISTLNLIKHIEGGYFAEIDRDPLTIPNPFSSSEKLLQGAKTAEQPLSGDDSIRNASTSIYYLLTPTTPQGHFHRNRGRTVHTVIEGKGRYVIIHADEEGEKRGKRVESFLVGKDVTRGEKAVWIVEGGKYKASFLLPAHDGAGKQAGDDRLLISEVCSI